MNTRQIDFLKKDCASVFQDADRLSELKNEHIFVTGGTGFVGKWIAEAISFLNESYAFGTKLTLLSRSAEEFKKTSPHLANKDYINLIETNVCDLFEIPSDVSWIIHAAATPDNREHSSNPISVVDTITTGTNTLLNASLRLSNIKKILFLSSGLIYGCQPDNIQVIDESFVGGPNTMEAGTAAYAEAKRMGESFCSIYRNLYRLPIVTARPFAFIGPNQLIDRPWAINNFLHDAFRGGPIRILGDHTSLRSYMYPSDMVNWLLTMLVKGNSGAVYNLGSDDEISLMEVANTISNLAPGRPSVTLPPEYKKLKHSVFVPSTEKAKSELGLNILTNSHDAIEKTINWFKHEYN